MPKSYSEEDLAAELESLKGLLPQAQAKIAEANAEYQQILGAYRVLTDMKIALNGKEPTDGDNDAPSDEA